MGILDDAIREHLELKRRHGADNQEVSRQEREILGGDGPAEAPGADLAEAPGEAYYDGAPIEAELPIEQEPLAGSPLAEAAPQAPAARELPGDIFPGTGELLAAASQTSDPTPAPPTRDPLPAPAALSLAAPAPSGADSETAARSGARRLSDDELAAWRRRLSERADRLAAQRPGTPIADAAAAAPIPPAPSAPATPAGGATEPPAYWSGNTTSADAGAPPAAPATPAAAPRDVPPSGVPVDFFDAGDAETAFDPEPAPEPTAVESEHDVLDETPDFLQETPEHDRMWFEQRPPRDFDFG